jgi:tetratricopeptide (TPR) repeat protein
MRKVFVLLLALSFSSSLFAQVVYDYLKGADNYFVNGDYYSAATYYEKYLGMKAGKKFADAGYTPYSNNTAKGKRNAGQLSSREQAMYNLAESYRRLHYFEKAEPAYKECLSLDKSKFPLSRYWYANTLRSLAKYPEAEAAYKQFIAEYAENDTYKETAQRDLRNMQFVQEQMKRKDLNLYKVVKTEGEVPDSGAVYAPYFNDNDVYYTSTKADKDVPKLQAHNNRVYKGAYDAGKISKVAKLNMPEDNDVQQGVNSIHPDSYVMYLTRWTIKEGKKLAYVCRSIRKEDKWSRPDPVQGGINVEGYSSQQPFVMPDGKHIIFSSDQPGGQGGFDLWIASIDENGQVGAPVNMGALVNSKWDEQAPMYHAASKTLVFSSNGWVGMGGYDFFYSKGTIGNWTAPVNFGYPVNSHKDDIYFASRGGEKNILDDVLLSSDRNDVCCLELFSLHKDRLPRTISGTVVSCAEKAPLKGASVTIKDPSGKMPAKDLVTDASGKYSFQLDDYAPLSAVAIVNGYFADSIKFSGPSDEEILEYSNPAICLSPFPKENPFRMNNVLFDYDSYKLRPESSTELDKLVDMMSTDTGAIIEIWAHTDFKGTDEYNMALSENRAKSVVEYILGKGIAKSRVSYKAFGRSQPIAPNENPDGTDNPEGRQLNRRIEVKVVNR